MNRREFLKTASGTLALTALAPAAFAAEESKPPLKSMVRIGCVPARVVRYLEEGFALEFTHPQDPETLEESVTAR